MFDDFIIEIFNLSFTILGQTISCSNLTKTVVHLLSLNNIQNELSSLWSLGSMVHSVILPFGYSLLTLFCMLELLQRMGDPERVTWERVAMTICKFIFIKVIMTNSYKFATMILQITQDIYHSVWVKIGSSGATPDLGQIMAEICSGSMAAQLGYFALTIIIWVIYLGTVVGVVTIVFTRIFKMVIYSSTCAIPLAMATNEATSQGAKRFFMSLASLGLEATVIMISTKIYSLMLSGLSDSAQGINVVLAVIIINALYLGLMNFGNSIARELTGA